MKNLFYLVMEADGDIAEPFDDSGGGAESADPPPDTGANVEDAGAPPESTEGAEDMGAFDDTGGDVGGFDDDTGGGDDSGDDNGDTKKDDEKLSEKANNILNQQLYRKMVKRNKQIEDTIENLGKIAGTIPYEIVKSNDILMNHLKSALLKGQNYVINDFVDAGYGENLLFYNKLDTLYTYLLNKMDANLKKAIRKDTN